MVLSTTTTPAPSMLESPRSISHSSPTFPSPPTRHTPSLTTRRSYDVPRRSFTVALRKLPKDFSTLIRSRSTSRTNPFRESLYHQSGQSFTADRVLLETEYANDLVAKSLRQEIVVQPMDVFSSNAGSKHPSRVPKSESSFYNFLYRSRSPSESRSRTSSKASGHTTTSHVDVEPLPPLPAAARSRQSGSSVMSSPSSTKTAKQSGAKPSSRLQSRPLSSTTTATNTTITPRTPTSSSSRMPTSKPKKPAPEPLEFAPRPAQKTSSHSRRGRDSRSSPRPSGARKKLGKLFGIGSSRKSSRANSPTSPADPLPTSISSVHTFSDTFKRTEGAEIYEQADSEPPESATSQSYSRSHTSDSQQSDSRPKRTTSGSKLARFFSGRSLSRPRPSFDSQAPTSVVDVSSPKVHRRNTQGGSLDAAYMKVSTELPALSLGNYHEKTSLHTGITVQSSESVQRVASTSTSALPRIVQTPPTPVKQATLFQRPAPGSRKNSTDSQTSTGWRPMAMVDEEGKMELPPEGRGLKSPGSVPEGRRMRSRDREKRPQSSSGSHTHTSARSAFIHRKTSHISSHGTKHGSFDFERPGWTSAGVPVGKPSVMVRSISGGSTSGGSARSGESGPRAYSLSKDSLVGGVRVTSLGSQSRSASARRTAPDMPVLSNDVSGKGKRVATLESDHTSSSTHTSVSGGTGLTSSFGRSSGKRITGGIARLFGGGSVGHGPFPFEPPVPSPTVSATSTQSSPYSHIQATEVFATEQGRALNDALHYPERGRELRPVHSRAPAPMTIPPATSTTTTHTGTTSAGHRSGMKGRSLDLGLGLSWAPSKVREDALLPFGRSLSLTRRSENGGRGKPVSPVQEEASVDLERHHLTKIGRDVAELFRSALDDEGFATFKTYVHRFDSHEIPFDGPSGIIARVDRLLKKTPYLSPENRQRLLDHFVRVLLQNA